MSESRTKRKSVQTLDLVSGPVGPTLLKFSLPFVFSMLLQTLYSTTDTIVVGQFLGSEGISAVSNAGQLMQLMYILCINFSNAGQVLIAQAKGAKNHEKLQKIIGTLFYLESGLSFIIGFFCLFFSRQLLILMSTPEKVLPNARNYVVICSIGIVFTGIYNLYSAVLRGMGDSKSPLLFVFIATLLNVVLDILFVAGLHWNAAGAASATVIGQAVSVLLCSQFISKHEKKYGIHFKLKIFRVDKATSGQLLKIGIPMAIQGAAIQMSFVFVASMVNKLGVTVSASFGVMQKLRQIPGFVTQGMGMGTASMIGQNLGARQSKRVDKTAHACILVCAMVNLVFGILYLIGPQLCFRIFTQDRTVLVYAAAATMALSVELPAISVMPACNGLVSAQGFVQLSLAVAFLDAFAGRVFFCWLLGIYFQQGAFGFFLGYVLGTYVTAAIVFIYYRSGLWKNRKLLT